MGTISKSCPPIAMHRPCLPESSHEGGGGYSFIIIGKVCGLSGGRSCTAVIGIRDGTFIRYQRSLNTGPASTCDPPALPSTDSYTTLVATSKVVMVNPSVLVLASRFCTHLRSAFQAARNLPFLSWTRAPPQWREAAVTIPGDH